MERTHTNRDFTLRITVEHMTPNGADVLDSHLARLRREATEIEQEFGPDQMLTMSITDEVRTVDENSKTF